LDLAERDRRSQAGLRGAGSLVWGEPDGGSGNLVVERHAQTRISATAGPKPFSGDTPGSTVKPDFRSAWFKRNPI
jgi:hypothetical protein